MRNDGVPIVLTASPIEMSDFNLNQFVAFTGGFPRMGIPLNILRKRWYPPTPSDEDGSAKFAPYGLRKVESLLIDEFGKENVVVSRPDDLDKFIGPNTKVIGISTMDPSGIGFVSRTYTSILGIHGEPLCGLEFRMFMNTPLLKKYKSKILVGGAGAWQIERAMMREAFGIDTLIVGEGERTVTEVFKKALNGETLPPVINAEKPSLDDVPKIKRASLYGIVEITRGCGRGCKFCSPTMRQLTSFPLEHVLEEARLNASNGSKMITLQTDDVFLYYRGKKFMPNREALVKLIRSIGEIPNVEYIQIAHAALAPVVIEPKIVEEIGPILVEKGRWKCRGKKYASVEVGLETGSIRLMNEYMRWKMYPYKPEDWCNVVVNAIGILNDNGIYPLGTLVTGLPGETEEDTHATLNLVDRLGKSKLFYVPLLFTAEEDCLLSKARHAELGEINDLQWELISTCWKHNIDVFTNDGMEVLIPFFASFLYPYFKIKHGSKILKPFLKFTGLSETMLGRRVGKVCEPYPHERMGDGRVGV
jgi:radical SAM superfamily enzyme YgiQ (UPF0313 family)